MFDEHEVLVRAMHQFWAKGYDATSMTDLVQAMGINSPSIYGAFGSKEELYRRAVALYAETEGAVTATAMAEQPTARDAVEAMLKGLIALYTGSTPGRGCMIVLGTANTSSASAEVHQLLRHHRSGIREAIATRLTGAVQEGELPADTDAPALALFFHTFLNGLSIQVADGVPAEALLDAVDVLMAGWSEQTD